MTWTWARVKARSLPIPVDKTKLWYRVSLTLTTRGIGSGGVGGGSGGTGTGGVPTTPPEPAAHFYAGTLVYHSDGYGSSLGLGTSTTPGVGIDHTDSSTNTTIAHFSAGVTYDYTFTYTSGGSDGLSDIGLVVNPAGALWTSPHLTPGSADPFQTFSGSFTPLTDIDAFVESEAGAIGHPPGGRPVTVTWVIDPVGWDPGGEPTTPKAGQWIGVDPPEVVTMTGPRGQTAHSFADGSLTVLVDNTNQTAGLLYVEGGCGDFTLGFTPTPTEVVTVRYQVRP